MTLFSPWDKYNYFMEFMACTAIVVFSPPVFATLILADKVYICPWRWGLGVLCIGATRIYSYKIAIDGKPEQ